MDKIQHDKDTYNSNLKENNLMVKSLHYKKTSFKKIFRANDYVCEEI